MSDRFRSVFRGITKAFGSPGLLLLVVALALICSVFLVWQRPQPSDDAYITFRHVSNLLEHGRPAWNLRGDPVLGSTTPAFLFTLAAFAIPFPLDQIHQAALYLNGIFHFFVVVFAYLVGRDLLRRSLPAVLLAVLIGVNTVNIDIFSRGFEAAMYLAVLLSSLFLVRTGRLSVAVFLASIAPLIRPEGVLLTPLVWGYILVARHFRWRLLILYLAVPMTWCVFSQAYYGSVLPHPLHAKKRFSAIYRPYIEDHTTLIGRMPHAFSGARALWDGQAGALLLGGATSRDFETPTQTHRRVLMLLGLPLAIILAARRRDGTVIHLLYAPMFLLFFGWLGHTQSWYFPSFISCAVVILFGGWIWTIQCVWDVVPPSARSVLGRWKAREVLTVVAFMVFVTANRYSVNHGQYDFLHRATVFPPSPWGALWDLWEVNRAHHYRKAAEYLNGRSDASDVALACEVGVLGYYFRGAVLDAVGLCSPEALAFYPPPTWDIYDEFGDYRTRGNNFVPTNMIAELEPDYVVNSVFYMMNMLAPGSRFTRDYEEVYRGGIIWGEPLVIYERSARSVDASGPAPREPG